MHSPGKHWPQLCFQWLKNICLLFSLVGFAALLEILFPGGISHLEVCKHAYVHVRLKWFEGDDLFSCRKGMRRPKLGAFGLTDAVPSCTKGVPRRIDSYGNFSAVAAVRAYSTYLLRHHFERERERCGRFFSRATPNYHSPWYASWGYHVLQFCSFWHGV